MYGILVRLKSLLLAAKSSFVRHINHGFQPYEKQVQLTSFPMHPPFHYPSHRDPVEPSLHLACERESRDPLLDIQSYMHDSSAYRQPHLRAGCPHLHCHLDIAPYRPYASAGGSHHCSLASSTYKHRVHPITFEHALAGLKQESIRNAIPSDPNP